ncbi:MAG: DUF1330 domain-containing protein [Minwuia sp.]|uniref:DUF1330 domain-containing protein n=1 Tax=Minwuia sp. TaxID=2493630 RepID=UPI003A89DF58
MSAYVIAQVRVDDPAAYQKYLAGFWPLLEKHGGELLTISADETEVLEGDWALPQTVVMRFPSRQAAVDWYSDPAYQALSEHRRGSSATNMVIVRGIEATGGG